MDDVIPEDEEGAFVTAIVAEDDRHTSEDDDAELDRLAGIRHF